MWNSHSLLDHGVGPAAMYRHVRYGRAPARPSVECQTSVMESGGTGGSAEPTPGYVSNADVSRPPLRLRVLFWAFGWRLPREFDSWVQANVAGARFPRVEMVRGWAYG